MRRTVATTGLALVLASGGARADVGEFGEKLPDLRRVVFGVSLPIPVTIAARSGSSGASSIVGAGALDTRVYFGHHGVLLGVGFVPRSSPSLLQSGSPSVGFFDLAYSFADFSSRRLRGFSGAVSFDAGPSLGLVTATYQPAAAQNAASNAAVVDIDAHATIGGRVSLHADLFVGPVMLGLVLGYRGGVPTNASSRDGWEGLFFANLELGGAFVR